MTTDTGMVELADFENPIVQVVYELICAQDEAAQPPEGEHWEGYLARRIVPAVLECLRTPTPKMVGAFSEAFATSDMSVADIIRVGFAAAIDRALSPSKGEGE